MWCVSAAGPRSRGTRSRGGRPRVRLRSRGFRIHDGLNSDTHAGRLPPSARRTLVVERPPRPFVSHNMIGARSASTRPRPGLQQNDGTATARMPPAALDLSPTSTTTTTTTTTKNGPPSPTHAHANEHASRQTTTPHAPLPTPHAPRPHATRARLATNVHAPRPHGPTPPAHGSRQTSTPHGPTPPRAESYNPTTTASPQAPSTGRSSRSVLEKPAALP